MVAEVLTLPRRLTLPGFDGGAGVGGGFGEGVHFFVVLHRGGSVLADLWHSVCFWLKRKNVKAKRLKVLTYAAMFVMSAANSKSMLNKDVECSHCLIIFTTPDQQVRLCENSQNCGHQRIYLTAVK